ncbi:YbhB/YbcL family Raf kinase inhibitor-like protein [Pontibacter anaerobius]|uniref:YbhB/YbcL family Raf kinase inhibitor-like protein n=1 Tax=Pontibacter anaerobius TaxID=2993940 RepID=A0ABT3RC53_9BACT|nr:YbhB/YbcL family Raf kinase inhibitor-like protein [Pontibacter anaerobius]MCX2738988.1 YbhB/YbcL family Raf kinase inhibitor-like protein [Pontibacter anaerobius]
METKVAQNLQLSSPSFEAGESIPQEYTCDGEDISPALEIGDFPEGTQSLVLLVDDPDAPKGSWTHWLMWDIPLIHTIEENSRPGIVGVNDFGNTSYGGPCPPISTHRYFFRLYALDTKLGLPEGSTKEQVFLQMENHILGSGELMGLYSH